MFMFQSNRDCTSIKYESADNNTLWNRIKVAYNIVKDKYTGFEYIENEDDLISKALVMGSALKGKKLVIEEPDEFDYTFNMKKAFPEAIFPTKAHASDVGWDLYTPVDFRLNPGETRRIDFGIIIDIHPDYFIDVRNRSSVVWKYSTMMALGVGTIDPSYRGSIMAPFFNFGREQMRFSRGDRLAQLVIRRVENIELVKGEVNTNTDRGEGGFGSSGR